MKDMWNKDPAAWESLTLDERLEAMRKWHCTGPSGQCAASMNTRETLNRTIREAQIGLASAIIPASVDDVLQCAYRELVTMQTAIGEEVVKTCIYPPTQSTLDAMIEHGYVMEAMRAVLRVIKYRKGMLHRESDE
jgi:hypothetical protein